MITFAWGLAIGYVAAHIEAMVRGVVREWRVQKAKVNEVRQRYGLKPEKRWWKL